MRISRLKVHGFGRLTDREFQFGAGLTIVHGPNESGKSTLHTALTSSTFGMVPGGRSSAAKSAIVERHRPWVGERYATTLELTSAAGRALRLDWDFDRRLFALRDAATGDDLTSSHGGGTDPDVLVEQLLGVSRSAYLRVGSVAQEELAEIGSEAGDVRTAIERAVGQSESETPAAAAVERLRTRRQKLVGLNRAPTNALPRAEALAEQLRTELAAATSARAEAEQLAAARDRSATRVAAIGSRIAALEIALEGARWRTLRSLVERAEGAEEQLHEASAKVAATAGAAEFAPLPGIDGARERYQDLLTERARLAPRRREVEDGLAQLRDEAPAADAEPEDQPSLLGWGIAAVGAVMAVGGFLVSPFLGVLGVLTLVAGVAIAVVTRRSHDHARELRRTEHDRLADLRRERRAQLEIELAAITSVETEFDSTRTRLSHLLGVADADAEHIQAALDAYRARIHDHAGHLDAERKRERAVHELERLLGDRTLEQARAECAQLEMTLNGHRDAEGADRPPAEIESEISRLRSERQRLEIEATRLRATVDERLRSVPNTGVLEEQLEEADEQVRRLTHADAVLKLAEATLAEAVAETYRDFAPRLNAALERNLSRATDGRYTRAFVADDLSVRVEAPETGAVVDLDQVSSGTRRLIYLVERLELVQLIAPSDEPLPVLLDEPFAHLDAERT